MPSNIELELENILKTGVVPENIRFFLKSFGDIHSLALTHYLGFILNNDHYSFDNFYFKSSNKEEIIRAALDGLINGENNYLFMKNAVNQLADDIKIENYNLHDIKHIEQKYKFVPSLNLLSFKKVSNTFKSIELKFDREEISSHTALINLSKIENGPKITWTRV